MNATTTSAPRRQRAPGRLPSPFPARLFERFFRLGPVALAAPASLPPDGDVLRRLRAGDREAQEQFVGHFWPDVQQEAARYARRGGPREDLLAEGALALWEAALAYDPDRHGTDLPTYVRNAVHRRVRRAYRKAMGFDAAPEAPLDWVAGMMAVEVRYASAEDRADLDRALLALPQRDRAVMRQFVALSLQGFGPDEAAQELSRRHGGTPAAWKKRLQRGRRRLQRRLRPATESPS